MSLIIDPPATPVGEVWHLTSGSLQTHHGQNCSGPCTLHRPSAHHMRAWALSWDFHHHVMFRLCPTHHLPHPDPDDEAYRAREGRSIKHEGCCGCCA